ncbi:MAG: hypothetical protein BWY95_02014 [Bacteroidetes bacterium ADurb.BinA104]|nr:MAG: hypothetical protein BWY95_02014 [Bacteroidetes bacterium ADurb.BinA104]
MQVMIVLVRERLLFGQDPDKFHCLVQSCLDTLKICHEVHLFYKLHSEITDAPFGEHLPYLIKTYFFFKIIRVNHTIRQLLKTLFYKNFYIVGSRAVDKPMSYQIHIRSLFTNSILLERQDTYKNCILRSSVYVERNVT